MLQLRFLLLLTGLLTVSLVHYTIVDQRLCHARILESCCLDS